MASENELLALRDGVAAAEYALHLAEERAADARAALGRAKDAYLDAALRPAERPAAGFTASTPGMPAPMAGAGILPCCAHASPAVVAGPEQAPARSERVH